MRTFASALLLTASFAFAQAPGSAVRIKHADEIDWKVSGSLPPGAEYHLVYEDRATGAVQTLARFSSGYALPPHSHTHDETILVVKGKLVIEISGQTQTLGPGSYAAIPAGVLHSFKVKGQTILLVALNGPYDIKGLPSVK